MNGQVYDYNLGRFLSVDPFIQGPGNSQSMNPYSYIRNNPLSGTDPSEYKEEKIRVKQKRANTGTRIKKSKTVTANITENSDGSFSIELSGDSGLVQAAASAVSKGFAGNTEINSLSVTTESKSGGITTAEVKSTNVESAEKTSVVTTRDGRSQLGAAARKRLDKAILQAWEDNNLGQQFSSEEAAAESFANAINPISVAFGVEVGANIFKNKAGGKNPVFLSDPITTYQPAALSFEALDSASYSKIGMRTAYIHTHGKFSPYHDNESFSGDGARKFVDARSDLKYAVENGINAYVARQEGS